MRQKSQKLLAWAASNERRIGATLFVVGFLTDIITFGLVSLNTTNYFFLAYLFITLVSLFGSHYLYSRSTSYSTRTQALKIIFPLVFQYCMGSLLSGTLIFYTRSGSVFVSWPFLLVFVLVFVGNEYFRMYKDRLVFQTLLFYLTFYAYVLFAYPFYMRTLTFWTFYISTGIAIVAMGIILWVLFKIGRERFLDSFSHILTTSIVSTLVMVGAYASGILPPLPLSLRDINIYHSVARTGNEYVVFGEAVPWYGSLLGTTVHMVPGESLFAYSSVFAPTTFTTTLLHVWERYDEAKGKWIRVSKIAFPLSGGRDGGYRGYSESASVSPGKWRVSVLTGNGQVIGRLTFTIVRAESNIPLLEGRK